MGAIALALSHSSATKKGDAPPPAPKSATLDANITPELAQAVMNMLANETDPANLRKFAAALRSAGYPIAALVIEARASELERHAQPPPTPNPSPGPNPSPSPGPSPTPQPGPSNEYNPNLGNEYLKKGDPPPPTEFNNLALDAGLSPEQRTQIVYALAYEVDPADLASIANGWLADFPISRAFVEAKVFDTIKSPRPYPYERGDWSPFVAGGYPTMLWNEEPMDDRGVPILDSTLDETGQAWAKYLLLHEHDPGELSKAIVFYKDRGYALTAAQFAKKLKAELDVRAQYNISAKPPPRDIGSPPVMLTGAPKPPPLGMSPMVLRTQAAPPAAAGPKKVNLSALSALRAR